MAIDDNTSYELTGAQVKDLASKINAKADSSSLAAVATTGSYTDLINIPVAPTVNDGTLTIQHNGTTKGTFTANQSTASTVNIETIYADDQIVTTPIDWSNILNHFYPVGSIYMSATLSTAAAVGDALGGTWVAWGAGRVPVGVDTSQTEFDTVEETGGAKTHTHGVSNAYADLLMDSSSGIFYKEKTVTSWASNYKLNLTSGSGATSTHNYGTVLGGNTDSSSTLQPYITCYMYKRTA